ncbi:putative membrane protein [Erwinia phage vB_EamM_RAY]|uniref:Membrane protein n=1 Tax=Erwinia phage vB_EamM_RAY TaxID=1815987 RepID=A0A173GDZ4_9CAUD|nr:hypothetical protein FDH98_gp091 [Erwinia phage vB_EamM_RAY]ANH51872.1 putative membrane protein [Erwinia phage vB_EamM_RAY]
MKRTKNIKLDRFRKAWKFKKVTLALMVVTGSFYLVACDEPRDQQVQMYQNADDCSRARPQDKQRCSDAYNNALRESERTAPRYGSKGDCDAEFGSDNCYQSTAHSPTWMSYMGGYMYGRNGSYAQPLYSSRVTSSPAYHRYVDAGGRNYGSAISGRSINTTRSALAPKPVVTSTITRGGFGASVAHMSSSHSSSSHSSGGHSSGG